MILIHWYDCDICLAIALCLMFRSNSVKLFGGKSVLVWLMHKQYFKCDTSLHKVIALYKQTEKDSRKRVKLGMY